jgi:hypothetical protein
MRYLINICLALAAIFLFQTPGIAMDNHNLEISATCHDNAACIYDGDNIKIDITIKNSGPDIIGFPLEYIIRRGPKIKLINETNQESRNQRISLAPYELLKKFKKIYPGESIMFDAIIPSSEILIFQQDPIAVTAEVRASVEIFVGDESKIYLYNDCFNFHIGGRPSSLKKTSLPIAD